VRLLVEHRPVLREEVLDLLAPVPGGVYLDATVGGGGHAAAILERAGPEVTLLAVDKDDRALEEARRRLSGLPGRVLFFREDFSRLREVAQEAGITSFQGILFDLGVSSFQLEDQERGFSYHADAPLDMRMDRRQVLTAYHLVNGLTEGELARIIRQYGEERWAFRIARFIVKARERSPITTTGELVEIIKAAVPASARRQGLHPARRTFQALRIAVNDELGALERGLSAAHDLLSPGGRLLVISFHSLEDRVVKRTFSAWARGCVCPPGMPECACAGRPTVRIITPRPVRPGLREIEENPRSRSARLRAVERLGMGEKR